MKFPFYIAKRYLFSSGSAQAINIITRIAATAIVVGAIILFVVLSAFDGLKDLHLEFTSVADPELKVFPVEGKFFTVTDAQKEQIKAIDGVVAYAEIVENQVLLSYKEKRLNAIIKGVDANYQKVIPTDTLLAFGDWHFDKDYFVVVGSHISNTLSLGVNNYETLLDLYMPKAGKGQITNPVDAFRREGVVVSGIYQLTNDLDQKYVFTNVNLARRLLNLPNDKISNIELKLSPNADYEAVKNQLVNVFNGQVFVKNRAQLNDAMYKMLNTEHLAAYLLSTLVLIIALFNLIGSMIMMIADKKKNLQTLFKLGANLKDIRLVFFFLGMLITLLSGILGIGLGVLIIFLQQQLELVMITPVLPYPTKLSAMNVLIVFVTLVFLGLIASIIASLVIKRDLVTDPN